MLKLRKAIKTNYRSYGGKYLESTDQDKSDMKYVQYQIGDNSDFPTMVLPTVMKNFIKRMRMKIYSKSFLKWVGI